MVAIPKDLSEMTEDWLSAALTTAGDWGNVSVSSVEAERFGEGTGIIANLFRLTPTYAPGERTGPQTLIAKLPSSIAQVREVARSYGMYEREVRFYRDVAATISLPMPRCFCADFDPETQQFVILLEDLAPARGGDQLVGMDLDEVRLRIESIAALHARWWDQPELKALEATIQPVDQPPYAGIDARYQAAWPVVYSWLASRVSPHSLRVAERLASRMDATVHELAKPPRTICHGDFRADNLMFAREPTGLRITVVDWQIAMQARGTFDIAYLMGGHVASDLRREHEMGLLKFYHQCLIDGGAADYDFEACLHDYRRAVLTGFSYWVHGAAAADLSHPRTEALFDSWARRLDAATQELGLAEFVA